MKVIEIRRAWHNRIGTWGIMAHDYQPFALTLEPPWLDNARNVSCIPPGFYTCQRFIRGSGQVTYQVLRVPGRSSILFHPGNEPTDSQGCILIGEEFGMLNDKPAILASRRAFAEFMALLEGQEFFKLKLMRMSGSYL